MIKFFRQTRHNMVNGNRFTKYLIYAVGEIILVVIGILIALQINNWNEGNKERKQEELYLKGFKRDLQFNVTELNRVILKSENTSKTVDSIFILNMENRPMLYGPILDRLTMAATGFTIFNSQEGTINDINGSGNLNVIKNDSIRLAIGSWNASLKELREWEKIEKGSWEEFIDYMRKNTSFYKVRYNAILFDSIERKNLLNDNLFMNVLMDRTRLPMVLNGQYKEELNRTTHLLSIIDKELKQ